MAYQPHGGGGEQAPPPAEDVDRISSLPEKARQRILGCLPLKSAVMLGMASKGWLRLVSKPTHVRSDQIAPLPMELVDTGGRADRQMAFESGGGGGDGVGDGGKRRRRVDEQGGQGKEEADRVDRISALQDDLRRRIVSSLPLKDAIRSGALSKGWRDFWKNRWSEPSSCLDLHIHPGDKPPEVLSRLKNDPRRRLDRFSLMVDNQRLRNGHLKTILEHAAEWRVEDLRIDLRGCKRGHKFIFHPPLSSPLLAHLSLRNINISDHFYTENTQRFSALEVIHLHSVNCNVLSTRVLELCPRLRCLVMRSCSCDIVPRPESDCVHSLRSVCYSGNFFYYPYHLLKGATLTDLYICFSETIPLYSWSATLPDVLSTLTIFTLCNNALKAVSSLLSDGPNCPWDKMSKLPNLKELQLLMYGMELHNLADIYLLLKSCHFSNLERLFVQLPATSSDMLLMDSFEDVRVELPGDSLVNLGMVKVMNFNWRCFEVQLVSVLLRKASLHKLLLISPNVDPLHLPGLQEADLLLLKEALSSGRIIISESDDPRIQPFHLEV